MNTLLLAVLLFPRSLLYKTIESLLLRAKENSAKFDGIPKGNLELTRLSIVSSFNARTLRRMEIAALYRIKVSVFFSSKGLSSQEI